MLFLSHSRFFFCLFLYLSSIWVSVFLFPLGSVRSTLGVFTQHWFLSGGRSSNNYVPSPPLLYLCLYH